MASFCVRLVLPILLLYIVSVREALPTAIDRDDSYQSVARIPGLYNSSDYVVDLNVTNFQSTIYGSEHGWLVEFYNSWCGFCQRFAPTWKSLAHNILPWKDILGVVALDCADDDNNQLCREYEIMRYPDVRYFGPHEKLGSLGYNIDKGKDMDSIRQNVILKLQKEQQEGRGDMYPNITPYRSSEIKNVWEGVPAAAKFFFFLFEDANSYLGSEIILDYHKVTSLVIRRVTSDNNLLFLMHKVTRVPTLIVFGRDGSEKRVNIRTPTREGTRKVIKKFMKSQGIDVEIEDIPDEHPGEWLKADVPPRTNIFPKRILDINPNRSTKKPESDYLHQADLETALRFSLGHEISMVKTIDGERMRALKNYTTALASYFPMKRGNPMFLSMLSFVVRTKESITGADFATLVTTTEKEMSPVYSEVQGWVGCKPSKPGLRGYPCGLWTLFHTLTVQFAVKSEEHPDMEPTQILAAIHGYVKHFFGCSDCAQHFLAMASQNKIFDVTTADESVLWLWRAHNAVNKRLAGDNTEDPEHIKIQYPSSEHCSSCRNESGEWNEIEVLAYLKEKYSYSGIKYESFVRTMRSLTDDDIKFITARKFGWDFTIFDISICVVLYIASVAILILVCIKFAVKRSYKKKMYIHSILGKV